MCRVLGVNRTSFHDWERRPPSDRALTDAWLTEKIRQIHDASRGVYGAPRVHAELRLEHGIRVGRKRVARLMKAAGIAGVRPRQRWRTTIRVPGVAPATDLVERDFRPAGPNVLWVADITYLRSGEGWLYLAAVQDSYSRAIVGWSMATHMHATLVVDALRMALGRRRPGPGLIHHSDHGSQGGFKWSSQLSIERSCDGHEEEAEVGSGWSPCDAVTGTSAGGAEGAPAAVLGGDRPRAVERGRCGVVRCVPGGGRAVVPAGWRHAIDQSGSAVRSLPFVRGARRDRNPASPGRRGAPDRAPARQRPRNDLAGVAP